MRPLILDYATNRKDIPEPKYSYDNTKSLNTISVNCKTIPFIDSKSDEISLLTKTKVNKESDDEDINLLELQTKTEIKRERDDENNSLIELETKTFVSREQDDEESPSYFK